MMIKLISALVMGLSLLGCATEPVALSEPPVLDPATGKPAYWLAKPAAAIVYNENYDKLWDTCGDVARADLFQLDRQDYRDGLLTTRGLVSKQIFEFWRPDTGDTYGVVQNSLQTLRRTIYFQFEKSDGGFTVTPKVLIERFSRNNRRVTNAAEYQEIFAKPETGNAEEYWYAIGRDLAMEGELAKAIKAKL